MMQVLYGLKGFLFSASRKGMKENFLQEKGELNREITYECLWLSGYRSEKKYLL